MEGNQKKLHENDVIDKDLIDRQTKRLKIVSVPILKEENFGEDMTIDDKNVGGEGYTIITNKETKKIAAMIMTTKHRLLEEVMHKIPRKTRWAVKTWSRDLAETYNLLGSTCFPNAVQIADKFHVIKLALQSLQDVRVRYRQQILKEIKDKKRKVSQLFSNGETIKELLARSRYLLFKFESNWTETQSERASILFEEFPEIKEAYYHIQAFRAFYNTKIGYKDRANQSLLNWFIRIKDTEIDEIKHFENTVINNIATILEYFTDGHTNAFAESLNARIQRFIQSNYGIHSRDFFHFRLALIFS